MDTATIMILRPMKNGDPTYWTYQWGQKAVNIARSLGYKVIDIQKESCSYENVSDAIKKYQPKLIASFSHGCVNSLQGQKTCMIAKKYEINEIVDMALSGDQDKIKIASRVLEPLGYINNIDTIKSCQLNGDPCDLYCLYPTNVDLLKEKIVFTTACFSAAGLGRCAIANGAYSYTGSQDLFLFPIDSMGSQDMYGNIQLIGFKELLLGHTVAEAEAKMNEEEDKLIRKFKRIKYIALTLLWNKKNRKVLGNENATIYSNPSNPFFGVPIIPWI